MSDVALIDAGGANLGSVRYALERLGATVRLVRDADGLAGAQRVILPGVGAAGPGMQRLHAQGLVEPLQRLEVPLMGICLGMQLLFERSEEAGVETLGLIPGWCASWCRPVASACRTWAGTACCRCASRCCCAAYPSAPAPTSHSYAAPLNTHTVAACDHGGLFTAVVEQGRYYGAQFHPERSGETGSLMLRNFLRALLHEFHRLPRAGYP